MIDSFDIFSNVYKSLIPALLTIAAIKVLAVLLRLWNKPKRSRASDFTDEFRISTDDIVTNIPINPKPASLASPSTPAENLPYEQRKPLTSTEAILYYHLVEALPECIILPQVQLSRFIRIKNISWLKRAGLSYALQNRIAQQSIDYLVCLKDFTIVAAVELDDKSHNNPKVKMLDKKKEESLKAAGVDLIRWNAESMPTLEQIILKFKN